MRDEAVLQRLCHVQQANQGEVRVWHRLLAVQLVIFCVTHATKCVQVGEGAWQVFSPAALRLFRVSRNFE